MFRNPKYGFTHTQLNHSARTRARSRTQTGRECVFYSHLEGRSKEAITDPRIVPKIDYAGIPISLQSIIQRVSWHLSELVASKAQHSEV
jgi:hypothetical protein